MTNNFLNINVEFGQNQDSNLVSTLMGVAVKYNGGWRIYDKIKKQITDIGEMQIGNLPIFIVPTTKLSEGDLIKENGSYYYVRSTKEETTETLCPKTGEIKTVVPVRNIFGINVYSKVISLGDSFINMNGEFDKEKLVLMSAMFGQSDANSSQMNMLLPLLFFKNDLNGDDDMMKMIMLSSAMTDPDCACSNSQMNQVLPLLLLKDKFDTDDGMLKFALLSSFSGGNNSFMSFYLMNELLKEDSKKEDTDKQSQSPAEETKQSELPPANAEQHVQSETDDELPVIN